MYFKVPLKLLLFESVCMAAHERNQCSHQNYIKVCKSVQRVLMLSTKLKLKDEGELKILMINRLIAVQNLTESKCLDGRSETSTNTSESIKQ